LGSNRLAYIAKGIFLRVNLVADTVDVTGAIIVGEGVDADPLIIVAKPVTPGGVYLGF
jgi:hypothetical protein